VGLGRRGYQFSLGDHGGQWIAVFYAGRGGPRTMSKRREPKKMRLRRVRVAGWNRIRGFGAWTGTVGQDDCVGR
jgi:hypothetical protein